MTGTIRLFRKNALKQAFEAGERSALSDTTVWREVFEAGQKKGSSFLNEGSQAPNFIEFMRPRRAESPGSFSNWFNANDKNLGTTLDRDQFEIAATEKLMEMMDNKKLIDFDAIEEVIKHVFKMPIDELRYNRRRFGHIKRPRFFAYYLAYHHCHNSLKDIGERWGNKNHATVLHGAACAASDAELYPEEKLTLRLLYRRLLRKGYNIDHFVQDDNMPNRCGNNRTKVKRVKFRSMRTISNIVVDIETIPGLDKPGPDDISVPANYKNPEVIEKYRTDPDRINELWIKQSLDFIRGRIHTIAWKINDEPTQSIWHDGTDEEGLLKRFEQALLDTFKEHYGNDTMYGVTWVSHNIKRFDMPFIWLRARKYKCDKADQDVWREPQGCENGGHHAVGELQ
jgi:hypothetical protein